MIPFIAVPILHSSGAWIASTAAGGYVAGTLSSTWVGAFILGNSGVLSSVGLVSASGIFAAAASSVAGLGSSAAAVSGSALTTMGLGGLVSSLGLAPTMFLGISPVGWVVAGSTAIAASGLGVYLKASVMKSINAERQKVGLSKIGLRDLIAEIREHEYQSTLKILKKLSKERLDFKVYENKGTVSINGESYQISSIKYVVSESGHEFLELIRKFKRNRNIFDIYKPKQT